MQLMRPFVLIRKKQSIMDSVECIVEPYASSAIENRILVSHLEQ